MALLDVAILRASPPRAATSTTRPAIASTTEPREIDPPASAPANATGVDPMVATLPVGVATTPVAAATVGSLVAVDSLIGDPNEASTGTVVTNTRVPMTTTPVELPTIRPVATSDTLKADLDSATTPSTILMARCDDVARRIIREGGHIAMSTLAREIGCAPSTLKRLMSLPIYRETYNRVSDEILGTVDDRINDERLDILARGDSLQRRAMTVLAECFEISRRHAAAVAAGTAIARPQLLKVAVDAAAEIRQVVSARSAVGANGSTINVNITRNHATIIQGALRESGVDLSDVLDGAFVVPATANTNEGVQ